MAFSRVVLIRSCHVVADKGISGIRSHDKDDVVTTDSFGLLSLALLKFLIGPLTLIDYLI